MSRERRPRGRAISSISWTFRPASCAPSSTPPPAMKAARVKGEPPTERPLAGKTLAMIFDRPSTRTRVSFDLAMRELGGETIMLTGAEMQLGRGETHRRHRARAVALCRRDHDPHSRSSRHGGARALRDACR